MALSENEFDTPATTSVRRGKATVPQARSYGGAFGGSAPQISFMPPQIFLFPEKFVLKI